MIRGLYGKSLPIEPYQEVAGILSAISKNDVYIKLTFTFTREIELPLTTLHENNLQDLVGSKIGIINIDGKFYIRELKEGANYDGL